MAVPVPALPRRLKSLLVQVLLRLFTSIRKLDIVINRMNVVDVTAVIASPDLFRI